MALSFETECETTICGPYDWDEPNEIIKGINFEWKTGRGIDFADAYY